MVDLYKKLKSPVVIGNKTFPNPIWLASGTVGFGEDLAEILDLNKLGGIVLKGTTLEPKEGNPPPRLVETPAGLINSIGLQNPGIERVIKKKIPFIKKYRVPAVLNIAGTEDCDFEKLAKRIAKCNDIDAVEINMSCPNVTKLMDNGTNPVWVEKIVKLVKKYLSIPVIAKITPNITDITSIALAAEAGGADAVSLINTLKGMVFDIETQKPILANKVGGLSGPAIRPIDISIVYEVSHKVQIPIIVMCGIMNKRDVFEFFCAGADVVQIGTLNFVDLKALFDIIA